MAAAEPGASGEGRAASSAPCPPAPVDWGAAPRRRLLGGQGAEGDWRDRVDGVENDETGAPGVSWPSSAGATRAGWLSANERPAPRRVIEVDDRLTADQAVGYASQGVAMLWRGDFHNAKQLLAAMDRRLAAKRGSKQSGKSSGKNGTNDTRLAEERAHASSADEFYRLRQARAQRSRILSLVLVPLDVAAPAAGAAAAEPATAALPQHGGPAVSVPLPRAPEVAAAVAFAYGARRLTLGLHVLSLQELGGVLSAHQWYLSGVDVPSLGARIHPHYGTFLPTRHEYVDLVAQAPIADAALAFDIGTGTGVLSAVLARRGVARVIGTDIHERAVACASENFTRLGIADRATAELCDMFPEGRADLIVCNPPWLPGSAATTLDAAVYDPGSQMLLQFLGGLAAHLTPAGEGWLVLSDLAELLGLRSRQLLLDAIAGAGLEVIDRLDTQPTHARARDASDVLHAARSREVTSLWRLRVTT